MEPVVRVTDRTYLEALSRKKGYSFMAFKLQWIWNDAFHRLPDSKWYLRFYDDNYIFLLAMKRELELYDSEQPLLVGHRHFSHASNFPYPDGGNPWVLSRGAVRLVRGNISQCLATLGPVQARKLFGPKSFCDRKTKDGLWCAEDIFLWWCMQRLGVKFVHYRGESWFPVNTIGTLNWQQYLIMSSFGITSQYDPEMLPQKAKAAYYCALHPVPRSLMHLIWKDERAIIAKNPTLPLKLDL